MNVKKEEKQIIKQIKKEMQDRDITTRALSKKALVAPSTIYDVIEGRGSPRLATLLDLCTALDLVVRVYNKNNCSKEDELLILISNLSKQKQKLLKDVIILLDKFDE